MLRGSGTWALCIFLLVPAAVHAQDAATSQGATESVPPQATATLTGTVLDVQGALIAGAKVAVIAGDGKETHTTTTAADGRFQFTQLAPGEADLRVTMAGFEPASLTVLLPAGEVHDLAAITMKVSRVSVTVDAIMPEQLAAQQLHAEEQQRLIGVFPNFFVSYNWNAPALTTRQKFSLATHNAIDPGNIFLSATVAGFQQAFNSFPGYGQGAQGYGKRFGADLANLEIGTYMGGAVLPTLFRQDPRYFYKGTGTLRSRFFYAVSRAVIARSDNGHWQPAYASVLGDLSAGALSNLYYAKSDRQGASLTLENGFLGIAGDAVNNIFEEFILKKLTPRLRKTTSNMAPNP